jgi:hypothetical protein
MTFCVPGGGVYRVQKCPPIRYISNLLHTVDELFVAIVIAIVTRGCSNAGRNKEQQAAAVGQSFGLCNVNLNIPTVGFEA